MFPLLLPVIIGSVRAMIGLLVPTVNEPPWLSLIIAFDCIFFALAMLLFQFVLEE
jgi:heme exporter protein B